MARNKLLKANGFPVEECKIMDSYPEVTSLLFADYLIGGKIIREKKRIYISLHLFEKESGKIIKKKEAVYPVFEDALKKMRGFVQDFFIGISLHMSSPGISQRVITSLQPVMIKEKILFVFNSDCSTREWAEIKKIMYILISHLTENSSYEPYLLELHSDIKTFTNSDFQIMGQNKKCQSIAFFKEENNEFSFILLTVDGEEKINYSLSGFLYPEEKANEIFIILSGLPRIPQNLLISEIKKNLYLEEKLDELLYLDKVSSNNYNIRIFFMKLLKSLYTPNLSPDLNMFSVESEVYWYYLNYLGFGIGYGFNLGYAGTIDSNLSSHPPVYQNEFRIIPLSLRSTSTISPVLNYIVGIMFHNIYSMEKHVDDETEITYFTYYDAGMTLYLKFGLNMGVSLHLSENFAMYLDLFTVYYSLPIIPHPQYDGIRHFSGDLFGCGISIGF